MKKIISVLVLFSSLLLAQHGTSPDWSNPVPIPQMNQNSKQRGTLYNNMVCTKGGRIIISTAEHNPSNMNQVYGYYITYSDDGGLTWLTPPKRFTPIDSVVGGNSLKLAIDKNDNIYAIWNSVNPSALFITRLDSNLNILTDSIRIATKINYNIGSTHITIDRYNRIHVMWNEGSTNSSNAAEVYYSRSTDYGNTWQTVQKLSLDDGKHSAFPHAQFDTAGDTLAIPWRDSTGGARKWDVFLSVSTNGGLSWSTSPLEVLKSADAEWDPDLIIDTQNRIHLFYTVYPASDPFNGARNYYKYSDDAGATWHFPTSPSNGMISANFRSHLIAGTQYDATRNILYTTWKDERDFDFSTGNVRGDVMLAYSTNRGATWSTAEFVTDLYDSTIGFKAGALLPTGEYCINYEVIYPENINDPSGYLSVFFKKRSSVVTSVLKERENNIHFGLFQSHPNPFNSLTTIRFSLPHREHVILKLFDVLGREVATLVDEELNPGEHSVVLDATNLSSGVYFYRLTTPTFSQTKSMEVIK